MAKIIRDNGTQALIETDSGAHFLVGSAFSARFVGFLTEYEALGGDIDRIHSGGYNPRNIAGTNVLSYHGRDGGRAIDINMSARNVVSSGLPGGVAQEEALAKKWGLVAGSAWNNPDRGHFEFRGEATDPLPGPEGVTLAPGESFMFEL